MISTRLMCYECLNLESIDLSEFSPNALTNMESMFEGCEGLVSINISKIPTSSVINTNSMFYGCLSLILIDMSNLNLEKVKEAEFMFYGLPALEYLILNEGLYSDPIKEQIVEDLSDKSLIICSDNKIDGNFEYLCCNYSLESHGCEKAPNYMIVYYGSDHLYTKGYKTDGEDKYNRDGGGNIGEYRGGIKYLINDNVKFGSKESFMIKAGSQLEIHFSYPIQNYIAFLMQNMITVK